MHRHRGAVAAAGVVVGVAERGREQRGDRLIGPRVLARVTARRIVVVEAVLFQDGEKTLIDDELHRVLMMQQRNELRRRQVEGQVFEARFGRQIRGLAVDGQGAQQREDFAGFGRRQRDVTFGLAMPAAVACFTISCCRI